MWVRVLPGFGGLDALAQLRGEGLGLGDLVCGHLGFQIVSQDCVAGLVAVGGGEVVPGMSLDEVVGGAVAVLIGGGQPDLGEN